MLNEFVNYDKIAAYHEMFSEDGISPDIAQADEILKRNECMEVHEKLRRVCLINPTRRELEERVEEFRNAGVELPCIYHISLEEAKEL